MVDEITKRRWETKTDPNDNKPIDALRMMIDRIESGELNPKHITICYTDDPTGSGYYQAGSLDYHGQMGLLSRVIHIMNET